jgi:hypothetical protein
MDTSYILAILWPLTVPAYVVVQIVVLLRSSGLSRWIAALPLVVMVPIFIVSVGALIQGSNLWFLFLYFASPVALLYVVIVALFVRPAARHSQQST